MHLWCADSWGILLKVSIINIVPAKNCTFYVYMLFIYLQILWPLAMLTLVVVLVHCTLATLPAVELKLISFHVRIISWLAVLEAIHRMLE